jgi:hypothetical protein
VNKETINCPLNTTDATTTATVTPSGTDDNGKDDSKKLKPIKNDKNKEEKRSKQREYAIDEIIETERAFYNEIKLSYDSFINDENTPIDFNKSLLFNELKSIIDISHLFISQFDRSKVGASLASNSEAMKMEYAKYLRNHSNITNLIKVYESDPTHSDYIKSRLNAIDLKVPDLATVLIKPVQRIFKYPLFINRLLENTETNNPDYDDLKKASQIFADMLEFINEYKRRKDLVDQYIDPQATKKKVVNMRTIGKKFTRMSIQVSNLFGLFNPNVSRNLKLYIKEYKFSIILIIQVYDSNFQREETAFRLIEKSLRNFFFDITNHLNNVRDVLQCELDIFTDLIYIFSDDFQTFHGLETSARNMREHEFTKYYSKVAREVLTPLNALLDTYKGPNILINKRNDKLIDYEASISSYKSNTADATTSTGTRDLEKQMEQCKKNYEALNIQLVEDLPILTKKSTQLFIKISKHFLNITSHFMTNVKISLKESIKLSNINGQQRTSTLTSEQQKIVDSVFINNIKANDPIRSLIFQNSESNYDNNQIESQQTEEHRKSLKLNYPIEKLYRVACEVEANETLCQLGQKENDLVAVVQKRDPSNQQHIWYVDNGHTKGFIPSKVLEPFTQTKNDLICFDENDFVKRQDEICVARYNFDATQFNMINLRKDKIYKIIEKKDKKGDEQWWFVESQETGDKGYIPSNYVKIVELN